MDEKREKLRHKIEKLKKHRNKQKEETKKLDYQSSAAPLSARANYKTIIEKTPKSPIEGKRPKVTESAKLDAISDQFALSTVMKKNRDSVLFKEGRNSIIKSNKATTIYFGNDLNEQEQNKEDTKEDESVKNNIQQWKNLRTKMDSFREVSQIEELKLVEKKSSEANPESKEKLRSQINQLLNKAKKIKSSAYPEAKGDKMVIMRPEAKNCDKSISIVRIRDISQVELTSLNLLPNVENNLEKFEDDVVCPKEAYPSHPGEGILKDQKKDKCTTPPYALFFIIKIFKNHLFLECFL